MFRARDSVFLSFFTSESPAAYGTVAAALIVEEANFFTVIRAFVLYERHVDIGTKLVAFAVRVLVAVGAPSSGANVEALLVGGAERTVGQNGPALSAHQEAGRPTKLIDPALRLTLAAVEPVVVWRTFVQLFDLANVDVAQV